MKKFTAIVLVLVMVLSLAACGKKQPSGKYGTKDTYISISNNSAMIVVNGNIRNCRCSIHGDRVYVTDGMRTSELVYDAANDTLTENGIVYHHFR